MWEYRKGKKDEEEREKVRENANYCSITLVFNGTVVHSHTAYFAPGHDTTKVKNHNVYQ